MRPLRVVNLYFDALFKELNEIVFSTERPFETVFIGGGNPGLLGAERLMKIARLLNEKGKVREFTIEMNPESLTDDMGDPFQLFGGYKIIDRHPVIG